MLQSHRVPRSFAVILGIVVTAACGGRSPEYGPDVWAVVDGRAISKSDVEKAYRSVAQPTLIPPPAEELLTTQLGVLDELITQNILMARARATGIDVPDAEIDKAFADRRGSMTDAAMNEQLSRRNLTQEDVREALRRELFVQKLLERDVVSKIAVTDAEIEQFFNDNRGVFNLTEAQYRIAQIVVTPQRNPQTNNRLGDDAATSQEALRKVEMLIARLKGGADFAEVAMDYSEDPQSAMQGGDLGFIAESALKQAPPQLRDVVLKMVPGNVNTLMVGGGYTIVLLVAHEPAGQRDLSTPGVRDQIRDGLKERRERLLRTAYLAEARAGAAVDLRIARAVVAGQGAAPPAVMPAPGK
jgi:peptidyl-prolyl cis-trans isomerase SurA